MFVAAFAVLTFAIGCSSGGDAAKDPDTSKSVANEPTKSEGTTTTVDFVKDVKPTMESYCAPCHLGEGKKGITLDEFQTNEQATANKGKLARMLAEVEAGKMPPPNGKPLPEDVKTKLVADMKSLSQ